MGLLIFPQGWRAGQTWTERLGGRERERRGGLPAPCQLWHQQGISHDCDWVLKWPENNPATVMSLQPTVNTEAALPGNHSGSEGRFAGWCHQAVIDVGSLHRQSVQRSLCGWCSHNTTRPFWIYSPACQWNPHVYILVHVFFSSKAVAFWGSCPDNLRGLFESRDLVSGFYLDLGLIYGSCQWNPAQRDNSKRVCVCVGE